MHTVEYSSASKRKGILTYATIWMNPKDTVLRQPVVKVQIAYDSLYRFPRAVKFIETKQNGGFQGLGNGRNGELVFKGCGVVVGEDEKVLELADDDGCMVMYLMPQNCTLKMIKFLCIFVPH